MQLESKVVHLKKVAQAKLMMLSHLKYERDIVNKEVESESMLLKEKQQSHVDEIRSLDLKRKEEDVKFS